MTEQVQNPARLVKPRIPGISDAQFIEGMMLARMHKQVRNGKTTLKPRQRSAAGLTHPHTYTDLAGYDHRTPHATNVLRRRRAKNKVAKQSRKANR